MKFSLKEDSWLSVKLGKPSFCLYSDSRGESVYHKLKKIPVDAFIFCKLAVNDSSISVLTECGFFLADTNITFHMKSINLNSTVTAKVRPALNRDFDEVGKIAQKAFTLTRFHRDPNIDNSIADSLKKEWAQNFFKGKRGTHMYVAEKDGKVQGFNQIIVKENTAIIDLIGVSPTCRGMGFGGDLIKAMKKLEITDVVVGTQLVNSGSIRFYQKLGFRLCESTYVFHRHGEK